MELERQIFFLLKWGENYDDASIRQYPIALRHWHVNELHKTLKEELEAKKSAMKQRR